MLPGTVKDIIKSYLRDNMVIKVEEGGFTNPNSREIIVEIEGEFIARAYFDVVQKREYEG